MDAYLNGIVPNKLKPKDRDHLNFFYLALSQVYGILLLRFYEANTNARMWQSGGGVESKETRYMENKNKRKTKHFHFVPI